MAASKAKAFIFFTIVPIIAGALLCLAFVNFYVYSKGPLQNEILVQIPKGTSVEKAAKLLAEEEVLSYNSHKFKFFRITYHAFFNKKHIHTGEYKFYANISPYEVLRKLTDGEVNYRKLTIPEGLMTFEVLDKVRNMDDLRGEVPGDIKEGELLPETYLYTYGDDRTDLIKRMYVNHYRALETLWQDRSPNLPIRNKQEALTLASIIEKETSIDEERPIVASVFINRLRKGMRLQTDPTVIYSITKGERNFERELTTKDLRYDSPYNTYRYANIPPGAICNPGFESIKAALNPAETDYLYFVADGKGGHNFSTNIDDHNKYVRLYRLDRKKKKEQQKKNATP